MQFTMVLTVEMANMLVICGSDSILDVIMNFIAIEIIAEFDDFFYSALPKKQVAKLSMKLLIKHTSSRRADLFKPDEYEEGSNEIKGYWIAINKEEPDENDFNHQIEAIRDKKTYLMNMKKNEINKPKGEIIVYA